MSLAGLLAVTLPAVVQAQAAPPSATEQPRFNVFEYRIDGNTVLATQRIERAVYPHLGEGRTIDDVEAARGALEQAYRGAGYGTVSVDIPPQKVDGGVVTLQVVEGKVSRLRVLGSRYYSQSRILATVPSLAEGAVPLLPQVQKEMVAVNTSMDKRVTPLLRPGREPGTTEVDLQVEDEAPLHGNVELNNQHAANSSPLRLVVGLRYVNLFQREHTLGLTLQTAPGHTDEVKVLAANYSVPTGGGASLSASFVKSDSSSFVDGGASGGVGVFGAGTITGLRWLRPLHGDNAQPEFSHNLTLGVDYKNFAQNVTLASETGFATPIHYLPWTAGYSGFASDLGGTTEFGLSYVFAIRGVASSSAQDFENKRNKADPNFSLLKFNLGRTWLVGDGMQLAARLDGQWTAQPLVSNEQFVAGGAASVRGYLESTAAADVGWRGSLEWRSGNLLGGSVAEPAEKGRVEAAPSEANLQARLYTEVARLRVLTPLPGSTSVFSLASVGTGLTLKPVSRVGLNLDVAWPLRASTFQKAREPIAHASLSYEF